MLPHRILIDERAIETRVNELASVIAADLEGRPPILLGLLTGSFVFLADLARALSRCGVEPKVDFLLVSHYGPSTDPTHPVQLEKDTGLELSGQAVLVVDDILDSGASLSLVLEHLVPRKPSWLRTCVLLSKAARRTVAIKANYVGFEVPDGWLIGYGLDLGGQGRALPYVGAVEKSRE
ncbi:MAG: hypoxanthine phosphoribosyltransferase [Nitrospirae bacterium]|nr:hypoxanthine phosphoribosyltransferase [Nitrospirota bacterium]